MKLIMRLVLVAAAAGIGFWLWTLLFPTPEKVILKRIAGLAATVSVAPGDGNLARANKVSNLISYFTPDVEINCEIPEAGTHTFAGRDEVRETAAGALMQLRSLKVQFLDAAAKIGADGQTAVVTCTAKVNVASDKEFGIQELRFQFKKVDGAWLICRGETVKTLQ